MISAWSRLPRAPLVICGAAVRPSARAHAAPPGPVVRHDLSPKPKSFTEADVDGGSLSRLRRCVLIARARSTKREHACGRSLVWLSLGPPYFFTTTATSRSTRCYERPGRSEGVEY